MERQVVPHILHQESVINDIVMSGPFAPKDTKPVMQLNMKYSFRFTWGGNPISTQIVKDPAPSPPFEIPGGGNILAEYKSSIRKSSDPATVSDPLTSDVTCLAARVLKSLRTTRDF